MDSPTNQRTIHTREQAELALRRLTEGLLAVAGESVRNGERALRRQTPPPSSSGLERKQDTGTSPLVDREMEALAERLRSTSTGLRDFGTSLESANSKADGFLGGLGKALNSSALAVPGKGSGLGSVLSGGLGMLGIAKLIGGLFRNSGRDSEPALLPASRPPKLHLAVDRQSSVRNPILEGTGNGTTAVTAAVPASSQVTVNINALDSQSFLDRSEDIANAVKDAMLRSHKLNDVVREL